MRKLEQNKSWVVYQSLTKGEPTGPHSVCEQDEWEAMERISPGSQTLIRGGIPNEGEAERLARGTAGDPKPRVVRANQPRPSLDTGIPASKESAPG